MSDYIKTNNNGDGIDRRRVTMVCSSLAKMDRASARVNP
jgi:hypothetical protein